MVSGIMINQSFLHHHQSQMMSLRLSLFGNLNTFAEFTSSSNFKSYDELSTRFHAVISGTTTVGNVSEEMDDEPVATPVVDTKPVESSQ